MKKKLLYNDSRGKIDMRNLNQLNKEDKMQLSNILDKYNNYLKTGKSVCTNFLNEYQVKHIIPYLNQKNISYSIYKPHETSEKIIIYFGKYENFITIYKVNIKDDIKHQHILGTLFSIGMNENTIGDIFVEKNFFYYTNLTRLNSYLLEQFISIKNNNIKLIEAKEIVLEESRFEHLEILLSSKRLDVVLSSLMNKSRSNILEILQNNNILLNYQIIKNGSVNVKENDVLSIHRVGKFKIGKELRTTKKEKIILEILKYR